MIIIWIYICSFHIHFFFHGENDRTQKIRCRSSEILQRAYNDKCYRVIRAAMNVSLILVFSCFPGCHEQGYAGDIIVYGIRVRSVNFWTWRSASHIQIGQGLACLNLLAMQPSTPISAYHHIKIIHTRIHTHDDTIINTDIIHASIYTYIRTCYVYTCTHKHIQYERRDIEHWT